MIGYILWAAAGFISGSIMYSYIVPKILFKKDITKISKDGNPGCGNVFTCVGVTCGILCLLLELAKGALPVWYAMRYLNPENPMFALVMAAPVIGHAFSPMLKRRGGKAIAVTFGIFIGIFPQMLLLFWLAAPLIIFSTVIKICPHSMRVMLSYVAMFICTVWLEHNKVASLGAFIIAAVVIFKHYGDFVKREKGQTDIYFLSHHLYHRGNPEIDQA